MAYSDHVDYRDVEAFRSGDMKKAAEATRSFPREHGIIVNPSGSWYHQSMPDISFRSVSEGPGHKPWLAEWMYLKTGRPYFDIMIWDTGLAAINDLLTTGHQPITITDDITSHSYKWSADPVARENFASGFLRLCRQHHMGILGGETASLPFMMNPTPPAEKALNMSATVTGILDPAHIEIVSHVGVGDCILGVLSNGPQVNGSSSLIEYGLKLGEKQFLTPIPGTGQTFGEAALMPTISVAHLVSVLMRERIPLAGLLPGTGDGLRKLFRMGEFVYTLRNWPPVPALFRYMRELGMPLLECVTTFNWGIMYYIFVSNRHADRVRRLGNSLGYEIFELGFVGKGEPVVDFQPEKLLIYPRKDQ